MIKKLLIALCVIALILGIGVMTQLPKFPIATGYAAKKLCSCTFIADRDMQSIADEDLGYSILKYTSKSVDKKNMSASASILGLGKKTAVYRGKLGCILLKDEDDHNIQYPSTHGPYQEKGYALPVKEVESPSLKKAVDAFFDPEYEMDSLMTRAVLVIQNDSIIAEQYAKGMDKDTEQLGWSMTKTITALWTGMMVKDDLVSITDTDLFPHWTDDRKDITLNNLLQMTSGLDWNEDYANVSGATTMLYNCEDIVDVASAPTLAHKPGEKWYYSSGTTNLINGYLKSKLPNQEAYLTYPHERIFRPLGMNDTYLETDESGNYIGSSYCYATARDWGRFGSFMLHDGIVNGDTLLPPGWMEYMTTPVAASNGIYGAQTWLNADNSAYADLPSDMYSANGYQGQYVFVIPSKNAVVVRLGLNADIGLDKLMKNLIDVI